MMARIITQPLRRTLVEDVPPLMISLLVAETFFKFGSFIHEAVAFLALWWALTSLYLVGLNWVRALRAGDRRR